jgi:glycosyltransferase involved in cell wall biosynthesis
MKKVLIVTYYWPPSGGAGVQRWLKLSKYLPQFGWEPVILTVDPQYAAYPATDFSLNEDLPESVRIFTTRATDYFTVYKKDRSKIPGAGFAKNADETLKGKLLRFVRGNFFIPDPRKGWNRYAFKKACELIEKEGISHIITTSPPHSTQLIGLSIKKKYPQIKWVCDLRDPWTDIYYYKQFYPTILSRYIDEKYEKSVLKTADKITTVGISLKKIFAKKTEEADSKTVVITNGYDEDDFKDLESSSPQKLTITYVGTLSDIYPTEGLVKALKTMQGNGKDFTLRFVGTVSANIKDLLLSSIKNSSVEFIPYVTHIEAIKYMMTSTVLVLIIPGHHSNKSIITGKLFEYVASGKPILCLGPADGDAAGIITECRSGLTIDYEDSAKISEFLGNLAVNHDNTDKTAALNYTRFNLAKRMSEVLNS